MGKPGTSIKFAFYDLMTSFATRFRLRFKNLILPNRIRKNFFWSIRDAEQLTVVEWKKITEFKWQSKRELVKVEKWPGTVRESLYGAPYGALHNSLLLTSDSDDQSHSMANDASHKLMRMQPEFCLGLFLLYRRLAHTRHLDDTHSSTEKSVLLPINNGIEFIRTHPSKKLMRKAKTTTNKIQV